MMRNNSIRITILGLLFFVVAVSFASATPKDDKNEFDIENAGMLTGRAVLEDGKPLPYGFVSFFAIDDGSGEHQDYGVSKRSPKMVSFIKQDGAFETQLFPAGKYFVGAVITKRWIGGPPKNNQKRYSALDSRGKYVVVEVKAAETVDIGTLIFKDPEAFPGREKKFVIRGRVLDAKGGGVPGSVVVAKKDITDPKGDFISKETDMLGVYELKIPPGKYFFVARKTLTTAGRPKPGGLMGTLGQDEPLGIGGKSDDVPEYITGKDGAVYKNVDITMFEVPIPEVKRKEVEAQVKAKKIDKSTLPADLPLMKRDVGKATPSEHKPEKK
jgi:hypothetical protein